MTRKRLRSTVLLVRVLPFLMDLKPFSLAFQRSAAIDFDIFERFDRIILRPIKYISHSSSLLANHFSLLVLKPIVF